MNQARRISRDSIARERITALLRAGRLPSLQDLLQREEVSLDELALDLLTHQVEIEVQAEQLRLANEALEAERHKFETIFHEMPVAALLVDLDSGLVTAENRQIRQLFPERYRDMNAQHYLRHFGENRFDQDRISLGLADCRNGQGASVKSVSLIDRTPDSYVMSDIRMARLEIAEHGTPCVLTIIQPYEQRF